MIPYLFEANERAFTSHGLGPLGDATLCQVDQDAEGHAELLLSYPATGPRFGELTYQRLILAAPDPYTRPQPYRIYSIGTPTNGLLSVRARHVVYDGAGIPVAPFSASSAADAAQKLGRYPLVANPFTVQTDITVTRPMAVDVPTPQRKLILETFPETYGGELVYDRFAIKLLKAGGADRGVRIRYGVDLITVQQERSIAETYTGILPYYADADGAVILGDVRYAPGNWEVQRIAPVDLTEYFASAPTKAQLNSVGDAYIVDYKVGVPMVNLSLSYAQIGQRVQLYDTVVVDFQRIGISVKAKIRRTLFDVLTGVYTSVEVGDVRPSIEATISDASRLTTGLLPNARIGVGAITEPKLASGSVSGGKIQDAAVSERALKALAVTEEKLAALAVTAPKIGTGAVTEPKIKDEAVNTPKIRGNAVTYAKLNLAVQNLFADILEANKVYAGVISSDGSVTCSSLILSGVQMRSRYIHYTTNTGGTASLRVAAEITD